MTRRLLPALAAGAAALAMAPAAASAAGACDAAPHPKGEWPTYGADLTNTRSQPAETGIGTDNASGLKLAFRYQAPGLVNTTPIVDGGCLFVFSQGASSTSARAVALDADTGAPVWSRDISVGTASFGGSAVSTPALTKDHVLLGVNRRGAPFVIALDRATGEERWRTTVDTQKNSGVNGSLVVHDGLAFIGFFGNADAQEHERGGFVLLDATTGELLRRTFVIEDPEFAQGYAGAGIWSTPAIDTATGYAYAGTSNPHSAQREHPRSNSILKIDVDRSRETFGTIVASYKGQHDTLVPGAADQPVCKTKPDVYYAYSFSATCLAIDIDFGASPNLFRTAGGKWRVGELQKSGVFHIVDATDLAPVSQTPVGAPCFACNAASSAFAGGRAFVAGGPPGEVVAVDGENGLPGWVSPLAGGFTFNPVSVANGVVWSIDSSGFLNGFDQATGRPVVKRSLRDDTGTSMIEATSSAGIAIARGTLYAGASTSVLAYRPAA